MGEVTVDFITRSEDDSRWTMVLVEEGPWNADQVEAQLRRVQDRLYACIEEQFPASRGKAVEIQVDFDDALSCSKENVRVQGSVDVYRPTDVAPGAPHVHKRRAPRRR